MTVAITTAETFYALNQLNVFVYMTMNLILFRNIYAHTRVCLTNRNVCIVDITVRLIQFLFFSFIFSKNLRRKFPSLMCYSYNLKYFFFSNCILQVVDFTSLDKRLVTFFTEMLTHLLLDYQESATRYFDKAHLSNFKCHLCLLNSHLVWK